MRDIVFKNLTSSDHHRRDICLSESFSINGITTKTEKHFLYNICGHSLLKSPQELENWLKTNAGRGPKLKDLSVVKKYDSKSGEEKFEVRIIGNLYVLIEQDIFTVDFTQIFTIDRKGETLKGLKS